MYTMVAALAHFHFNLNNVYMTMMMVAPMTIIMLVSMRSMFPSSRLNIIIGGGAIAVFFVGFVAMRTQAGIGWKCRVPARNDPTSFRRDPDVRESQYH